MYNLIKGDYKYNFSSELFLRFINDGTGLHCGHLFYVIDI